MFVGSDPAAQYRDAVDWLRSDAARLATTPSPGATTRPEATAAESGEANIDRPTFEAAVRRAIEYVHAGDAFQIVPSVRFSVEFDGDAFAVYRALRLVNPSPFMYFFRHGSLSIAGSSPELMTRVRDGVVVQQAYRRHKTPGCDAGRG